jgi:hypothetical protein
VTNEKRILISPKDILSLGFECSHCGATYFVPVDKLDRMIKLCPNCQQLLVSDTQLTSSEHSDSRVLQFFVDFLRQLRSREFGATVRFEIAGDSKKEIST